MHFVKDVGTELKYLLLILLSIFFHALCQSSHLVWKRFKEICITLPAEACHILVLVKRRQEYQIKKHPMRSGQEISDLAKVSRRVLTDARSRRVGHAEGWGDAAYSGARCLFNALFPPIWQIYPCHLTLKSKQHRKVCLCLPGRFHPNFTVIIKSYILIKEIRNYNKVQGTCKMNN